MISIVVLVAGGLHWLKRELGQFRQELTRFFRRVRETGQIYGCYR